VGQWLQINFNHPMDVGTPVNIRLLDDVPRPVATRLTVTSATGHVDTTTRVTGATQKLNIPSGTTSWLRITIDSAQGGTAGGPGAGISGIAVPGVWVNRFLQPSQTSAGPAPSFSFQRDLGSSIGLPGSPPEAALNRTFTTTGQQKFTVAGTVTAVPGSQLDSLLSSLDPGPTQLTISASSTFGSLAALSPRNLLNGSSSAGWIAADDHASLHLKWTGTRSISQINLTAPTEGIAAQPTRVLISSPAGTRDVPVPLGGVLHFAPLKTSQLTISFVGVMATTAYNPLVGRATQLPVGLAGLTIPALQSLNTGIPSPTTAVSLACGQGPSLTVDGKTYPTSVSGTVADLTSSKSLPLHLCTTGTALTLASGRHFLTSPGYGLPLTVTGLTLKNASTTSITAGAGRTFTIKDWGTEHRTGTVSSGDQAYLEVHQAAAPGWTATLGGKTLKPVTLDGWQQAFIVPAGPGGTVTMSFAPVNGYHLWLIIAFVAFALLLILALWPRRWTPGRLRRRDPGADLDDSGPATESLAAADDTDPDLVGPRYPNGSGDPTGPNDSAGPGDLNDPDHPGRSRNNTEPIDTGRPTSPFGLSRYSSRGRYELSARAYWITVAAATIVLALVSGWLAFVVLGVLLVGWVVPRWVPWLAFLGMCVAGGFAIAELSHGPAHGFGAFGWPAQAAAVVALAAALVSARRRGRAAAAEEVT
jgi:arabinofuranan 3-O-arabinosyltransferase